jgi:trehalose/maltose transport system substrate-binding protein
MRIQQAVPRIVAPILGLILIAVALPTAAAPQVSEIKINEWPRSLRTDLRGTSIKVVLPENALDTPWNDALIAKFHALTGINVAVIRPGNDMTAVLANYRRDFEDGSADADVYAIDIVWPGMFSDYAEDLRPLASDIKDMLPTLIQNDTVRGKLIAIPYFTEVSLLFYRRDLLQQYGFHRPPVTWKELEEQARVIQNGERKKGNQSFWGFLWQGAASEALTCNALEWQISDGAGPLLHPDGRLGIEHDRFVQSLERARNWIGSISPPQTPSHLEDDSLREWKQGNAAFMRNWPYAYPESMAPQSHVRDHIGVTILPKGAARHADMLGGFQLMVSKTSKNKKAAIEFVKFLTSPEIQRVNATTRGYIPTRRSLYYDAAVLKANPFFRSLRSVLLEGAVTRPSTAAGKKYGAVSEAYFTAVHQVLTGKKTADAAVTDLEGQLRRILK